jgi:hypothetical protein
MNEVKISSCNFCSSENIIENMMLEATSNKNDLIKVGFYEDIDIKNPGFVKINACVCRDCGSILRMFIGRTNGIR